MLSYMRNNLALVTAAVVVMLILTAGLVAWQVDVVRVNAQEGSPAGEESSRGDHNDKLGSIGNDVPGFGGLYFEPGNEDILKVFLTDPEDADAAGKVSGAIAKEFPDAVPPGGIEIVQGKYSMSQLTSWYASLRRAIGAAGLVGNGLVFTDLHEGRNLLEVAVDSEDSVASVESAIANSGVPAAAVLITVTEPMAEFGSMNDGRGIGLFNLGGVSMDHQTILDRFRPLFGGLRIMGGGGTGHVPSTGVVSVILGDVVQAAASRMLLAGMASVWRSWTKVR